MLPPRDIDPFVWAVNKYAPNPKLIADIGSYDCAQSVFFKQKFPECEVIAFEPDPNNYQKCLGKDIEVVNVALDNVNGKSVFYSIKDGTNSGASSFYQPKDEILPWDKAPEYTSVEVETMRGDSYFDTPPDALWMDVQGAELRVLEGFGELIHNVKVIATEAEITPVYHGKPAQVSQIFERLVDYGFYLIDCKQAWEKELDALFVRKDLL